MVFWPMILKRRDISRDARGSRSASRAISEFLRRAAARAGRSVRFGNVGRLWAGGFICVSSGGTEEDRWGPTIDCRLACSSAGRNASGTTGLVARGGGNADRFEKTVEAALLRGCRVSRNESEVNGL